MPPGAQVQRNAAGTRLSVPTFLEDHVKDLVSVDFFLVPTVSFKVLVVFHRARSRTAFPGFAVGTPRPSRTIT